MGEVTFADSGWTDQEYVFGLFKELAGSKLIDLLAVDVGVEAEVKTFKSTDVAEGRTLGASFDGALLADIEFVLEEEFEELLVGEVVADGFLKPQIETGGKSAEAELLQ